MANKFALILLGVLGLVVPGIFSLARLVDPLSRGTEHIAPKNKPHHQKDYVHIDDYEQNCGGVAYQWSPAIGGNCGTCGDPYGDHQHHVAGGMYATGKITRQYKQGSIIGVEVYLVENKLGWMEFRICPNNDPSKPVDPECLNQHLLDLADGSGTRFTVEPDMKLIKVDVVLPPDMVCTQCVIQWKYHTGAVYNTDPETDTDCFGCGPQEEYYNCADVSIEPKTKNMENKVINPAITTTELDSGFNHPQKEDQLPLSNSINKPNENKGKGRRQQAKRNHSNGN